MKLAIFILSAYLIVVFSFAGLIATIAALVALILIVVVELIFGLKEKPYFDSEDIGMEAKPYVKRIGMAEVLIVVICAALLLTCYIILP